MADWMYHGIPMDGMIQSTLFAALLSATLIQSQVLLIPPPMQVVFVGDSALFQCLSNTVPRTTESIEWFINGSSLVNFNTTTDLLRGVSNEIQGGTLVFAAVPVEYNMTRVYCRANFTTGDPVASTTTQLIIQGLLDAVDSMACVSEDFSRVLLNWTSPFALIGASEITYCVDVVDLTNRRTLQSECMITMTQFTYAMPRKFLCSELSFTVTPVNVVGNGTTSSVQQTNCSTNPLVPPQLINVTLQLISFEFLFVMSAPVCTAELMFEDVDTGENIESNVTVDGTSTFILLQQLRENRDYNVTITASNIAGKATSMTNLTTNRVPTTETGTSSSDSEPAPRNSSTRVIIGAVVGPIVAGLIILSIVVSVCVYKRKKLSSPKVTPQESVEYAIVSKNRKHCETNVSSEQYRVLNKEHHSEDASKSNSHAKVVYHCPEFFKLQDSKDCGGRGVFASQGPELISAVFPGVNETETVSSPSTQVNLYKTSLMSMLQSPPKPPRVTKKPDINYMEVQAQADSTAQVNETSCYDAQYYTIGGSSNNGLTYAFVDPKSITVGSGHEISKAVNEVNYSVIQPQGQQAPDVLRDT